jgi:hypothetical protein
VKVGQIAPRHVKVVKTVKEQSPLSRSGIAMDIETSTRHDNRNTVAAKALVPSHTLAPFRLCFGTLSQVLVARTCQGNHDVVRAHLGTP